MIIILDKQEHRAYKALFKWSERLNAWEYSIQYSRSKKKLKVFFPNAFSLQLIENMGLLCSHKITPEEAMSILHTVEGKTELRLCMEAGF